MLAAAVPAAVAAVRFEGSGGVKEGERRERERGCFIVWNVCGTKGDAMEETWWGEVDSCQKKKDP